MCWQTFSTSRMETLTLLSMTMDNRAFRQCMSTIQYGPITRITGGQLGRSPGVGAEFVRALPGADTGVHPGPGIGRPDGDGADTGAHPGAGVAGGHLGAGDPVGVIIPDGCTARIGLQTIGVPMVVIPEISVTIGLTTLVPVETVGPELPASVDGPATLVQALL